MVVMVIQVPSHKQMCSHTTLVFREEGKPFLPLLPFSLPERSNAQVLLNRVLAATVEEMCTVINLSPSYDPNLNFDAPN